MAEDKKTTYRYQADTTFDQYLDMCKKDISENLSQSIGGLYIGSDTDKEAVLIAYGKTEIIRKGLAIMLQEDIIKQILLEELEKTEK